MDALLPPMAHEIPQETKVPEERDDSAQAQGYRIEVVAGSVSGFIETCIFFTARLEAIVAGLAEPFLGGRFILPDAFALVVHPAEMPWS